MGCAGSKAGGDVAVADVYRPPPTSVSLFDISAVEERWLIATDKHKDANGDEAEDEEDEETDDEEEDEDEKPANTVAPLPLVLLDKLEGYELAPASWSEVSKALEDMKPVLDSKQASTKSPSPKKKKKQQQQLKQEPAQAQPPQQQQQQPAQMPSLAAADEVGKKAPLPTSALGAVEAADRKPPPPELTGRRVVKDNPFLMRDRENKDNVDGAPKWRRRDPFRGMPRAAPGGRCGRRCGAVYDDAPRRAAHVRGLRARAGAGGRARRVPPRAEGAFCRRGRDGAVRGRRGGVRAARGVGEAEGDDAVGQGARRGLRHQRRARVRGVRRGAVRAVLGVRR